MSDYWPDIDIARRVADLPLFAAARKTDPPTSKAAAAVTGCPHETRANTRKDA